MKITTHVSQKASKKVEKAKEVVKPIEVKKEEIPNYKIVLPKEPVVEVKPEAVEPLFSPEVEKLLEEEEDFE
jgi:hypothetical protein